MSLPASRRPNRASKLNQTSSRKAGGRAIGCAIESLERRLVFSAFATLTVDTLQDNTTSDSTLSLREAVALINNSGDANAALGRSLTAGEAAQISDAGDFGVGDHIVFDSSLAGQTISLGSELAVTSVMSIDASKGGLTIDGGYGGWRAFNINGGDLTLAHLTIGRFRQYNFSGGAIYAYGSSLTVDHCNISNNGVSSYSSGGFGFATPVYGGAIYASNCYVIISDSLLSSNSASGSSSFYSSSFATGGSAQGGAIMMSNGELDINRSTFSSNSASGGSAYSSGFSFGSAYGGSGTGGAIAALSAELHIIDSTLTGNSATGGYASGGTSHTSGTGVGGAIYASVDDVTIDFSTLSANTAANGGRDLHYDSATGQTLLMHNSILGQSDSSGADFVVANGTPLLYGSNNLIRSTTVTGIGVVSTADPLLGALADNGGPTLTMAPQAGSPAINAGSSTSESVDQRGAFRTNGSAADIGALERFADAIVTPADFASAASVTATQGSAFSFTITTTGAPTATLTKTGTLPTGVTFTDHGDGTATLAGTPATGAAGDFALQLTADNADSPPTVQDFVLSVLQSPAIVSADHATFVVGTAGSFTFSTTAAPTAALTEAGALPSGVTFTDNGDGTATLAGTPATGTAGDFALDVTADTGHSPTATQAFVLTVVLAPAFTSVDHASFDAGTPGSFTISTTGSPIAAITETGALPSGLTLTDNGDGTATISGTAITADAGDHVITLSADNGVTPATQSFTITVVYTSTISPTPIVTGNDGGSGGITVTNEDGSDRFTIADPFVTHDPTRIASGDVSGDGIADIILAAGKGGRSMINIYDGTDGSLVHSFAAFSSSFTGTVYVASGDVNGDGVADLVVGKGAEEGASARFKVFNGVDYSLMANIIAFGSRSDARVAVADLDGDGFADVVVMQGPSRGTSKARAFSGADLATNHVNILYTLAPFHSDGGGFVATGDVNHDGQIDVILTGTGKSYATVSVFSGDDASQITSFTTPSRTGAIVASHDTNNDGYDDILVGVTDSTGKHIKVFSGLDNSLLNTIDLDPSAGLFVA